MAVLTRAKALKQPGSMPFVRHGYVRRSRLPAASAVRQYWTCRHPNGRGSASGTPYSYIRPYPQRSMPRYDEHVSGLDYGYMAGMSHSRSQFRRPSSNWAPEDEPKDRDTSKEYDREKRHGRAVYPEGRDPWETRTRQAGERYLRLMEQHMKILKKDPYWGLFGGSEIRGVWNPWRRYYEMHKLALKRRSEETFQNPAPQASASRPQQSETQGEERYRVDPITNKKVPCENPKDADIAAGADNHPTGSSKAAAPITIPVKTYNSSTSTSSRRSTSQQSLSLHQNAEKTELAGFARQPWLIQEGFVRPGQKIGHLAHKEPRPSVREKLMEDRPKNSQERDFSGPTAEKASVTSTSGDVRSAKPARLTTALDRSMYKRSSLEYDEAPDKREDLDLLRASDVRAKSGKATKLSSKPVESRERRWEEIEDTASNIFKDREERLNKEFAADRWELSRNFSAYPGEIAKTFEEKRARRRLLERSFNSSLNKFEMEIAKILGTGSPNLIVGAGRSQGEGEQMNIHSYESMRKVAKHIQAMREELNDRYSREAKEREDQKKRQAAEKILLQEIDEQRIAMTAYENKARAPISGTTGNLDTSDSRQDKAVEVLNQKHSRTSQDKRLQEEALVEEIRSIYEDGYGTIASKQQTQSRYYPKEMVAAKTLEIPSERIAGKPNINEKPSEMAKMEPQLDASQEVLEASIRDFETLMRKQPLETKDNDTKVPKELLGSKSVESSSEPLLSEDKEPSRNAISRRHLPVRKNLTYLLLAYDKAEDRIRIVRTSSSKYERMAARRTVDSILSRLDDPIPYLDHMERLEKSGYELVAGSRKMLVYKDRLNRASNAPLELDEAAPVVVDRGWGSPVQEGRKKEAEPVAQKAEPEVAAIIQKGSNKPSKRVRRMEENFSGPGPRFVDEPAAAEEQHEEKQRQSRSGRVIRVALAVVGLVYACGVTLEWMKEREKQRLVREYQQEVQRVKDMERQRALEGRNGASRWGF